jgi:hypothetical protein
MQPRQPREHIAVAIAYAHEPALPLSILSEPDASSEAQIGFSFDDWLGS